MYPVEYTYVLPSDCKVHSLYLNRDGIESLLQFVFDIRHELKGYLLKKISAPSCLQNIDCLLVCLFDDLNKVELDSLEVQDV